MDGIPPGALEFLLQQDGIDLPGKGQERQIKCFNPHHNYDFRPSMRVNVVLGVYHCYGCDISGNSWTYLTQIRGFSPQEARAILKDLGWPAELFRHALKKANEYTARKLGRATYTPDPYMLLGRGRVRARAIGKHEYRLADGKLICLRVRYEKKSNRMSKVWSYTPCGKGGWWVAEPDSQAVPLEDRHCGKLPLYRLPYLLQTIQDSDQPIWIVEGEKCVDAVIGMKDSPVKFPVTCLFGSMYRKPAKCDLSPLKGQNCLLFADTDGKGRAAMKALARALEKLDCTVGLVLPEGEGGYDIADAIAEGGYKALKAWVEHCGIQTWPTWEHALKKYLNSLSDDVWALKPDQVYAVCGHEKHPDKHLIQKVAAEAGWEYKRVKRRNYRDKMMFERKDAKPKNLPRGRPFAQKYDPATP